ncbi:MAG: prepilin peptidase [Phycisphaerales bacterium]
MPNWLLTMMPLLTTLIFVIAVGACVGSLVNVLVYRLPRGEGVVIPSSRCPWCGRVLTWKENIPIFGWLILRGRCRFCTSPISPEYPIVESIVAVLFGVVFALWYVFPADAVLGLGTLRPEWAINGAVATWPAFVVLAVLIGCLVAMTIIDARTFTIPLVLTWVPVVVALVFHVGHAAWAEIAHGAIQEIEPGRWQFTDGERWRSAPGWLWTLATPALTDWRAIGVAIGGTLGLGVSLVLLRFGLITHSFDDYDAWERDELARIEAARPKAAPDATEPPPIPEDSPDDPAMWIMYPHARREMVKELAFLAAPAGLGYLGAMVAPKLATGAAPLWLTVLAGVLLGYLIGGAVVWAVRIGGSIAFGKEAMGLGDVHLMAAVGACLGWADSVIAFFGAAFVGLAYVVVGAVFARGMPRAMPYGPFLAVATVLVLLGKPALEAGLTRMFGTPVNLP